MVYFISTVSLLLLVTGFSQQASTYNRASDDEVNSYEGDQQLGYTSLGTHGGIQLLAVPRNYLNPFIAKDLFKRVALTPRIGRSDGSSIGSKGWLDDDDYYNRIIKSSFTPRVGRSVDAVNGDKSMKSSKP
uniref:Uncharacterized protein n=1 Tax=Tetranychus urticae TaxID=32264 RepID=T1K6L6_TETUR